MYLPDKYSSKSAVYFDAVKFDVPISVVISCYKPFHCIVKKRIVKSFKPLPEDEALKIFARRLKAMRKAANKSQLDLAFEKEVNLRSLSAWETGTDIKLTSIVRVCNALGITLKEFFAEGFE